MLQGDVVEDTASQDDVAALLRGVLQCPLGAVQAAESGAQGSESLLDHTVSRRMGHVVAIFGWSFRNVKWSHKPGAEKEGAVTKNFKVIQRLQQILFSNSLFVQAKGAVTVTRFSFDRFALV